MIEDRQISNHFWLSEFNFVEPDPRLLKLLEIVRDHFHDRLVITESTRTLTNHIQIYKDRYGKEWLDEIPWKSRHLPTWRTPLLRAVDFKVVADDLRGLCYHGEEIYRAITRLKGDYCVGVGIADYWVHLDVDRWIDRDWRYY